MPSDSRSSIVAGTSSSDLMPDETTSASVRASSPRSAEMSMRLPRCTPPIPPVPRKPMPAARQAASVPPTVVAPTAPWVIAAARSRVPTFRASAVNRSSSESDRPIRSAPSSTPTVAGRAPASRTARADSSPTANPSPAGKPWATSVVSSATTGARRRSASSTSGATLITASPPVGPRSERRPGRRAPRRRRGTRPRVRRPLRSCPRRRPAARGGGHR